MTLPGTRPDQLLPAGAAGEMAYLSRREAVRLPNEPIVITANTTAQSGGSYIFGGSCTLTLPASPLHGDRVEVRDRSGTTTCAINPNGKAIRGDASTMTLDIAGWTGTLTYNALQGEWA